MATSNNNNRTNNKSSDFSLKALETMTVVELRDLALDHDIETTTRMRKNDLVQLLFSKLGITQENLEALSIPILKELAAAQNMKFIAKIRKQDLIDLLLSDKTSEPVILDSKDETAEGKIDIALDKQAISSKDVSTDESHKKNEDDEHSNTHEKKQPIVTKKTEKKENKENNEKNEVPLHAEKITKELLHITTLSLAELKLHAKKHNYKFNPRTGKEALLIEITEQIKKKNETPLSKAPKKPTTTKRAENKNEKQQATTDSAPDKKIDNKKPVDNAPTEKTKSNKSLKSSTTEPTKVSEVKQDMAATNKDTSSHNKLIIEKEKIASDTISHKEKKKSSRKKKKSGRFGRVLWRITCVFFILIFVGTLIATHFVYQYYLDVQSTLPPLAIHKIESKMKGNTGVYDKDDTFVANLAEESYVSVVYEDIPESLLDAMTAAEDARFLRHKGIDGPRTVEAVIRNIVADDITSGGSTITQQLIKETSLKDKIKEEGPKYKNSNERKIHEWILSYQLEHEMDKKDIITAYFNTLGYGRFTGVGTAAKRYFNKNVSELTTPEAILLAGIPQASSDNDPYQNMDTAKARFDTVTYLMWKHGHITEAEEQAITSIPLGDLLLTDQENFTAQNYNYFSGVQEELHEIFNIVAGEEVVDSLPFYTGYKIYTELDQTQQNFANQILDTYDYVDYMEMLANLGIYEDDINMQAAFTVVNTHTGGIPAIGAARRFKDIQINFALTGERSPGSAIKPIIDYAPGMESLGWTPFTPFQDKKTFYTGSNMQVSNFGGSSGSGKSVLLQDAVSQSLNTTAVQAIQKVGVDYAGRFAGDMGISSAQRYLDEGMLFESAALGGGIETTTTEMAGAYATFANAGQYNKPHFIRRIENSEGDVIYQYNQQNTQVMSPNTAKLMTDVLIHTRRTGTPASPDRSKVSYDIAFAAKTGTSSYSEEQIQANGLSYFSEKDHWIVGYSPEYSIAVWTGFNIEDNETLQRTRGNQNSSKSYGSHIMAAWMNTFSPPWTGFNFDREFNPYASLSGLAVTHDEDLHKINWKAPTRSYPTQMDPAFRSSLGPVVYDIYIQYEDEDEELILESVPAEDSNLDYTKYIKGNQNFKFRIVARFAAHHDQLSRKSEIIIPVRMSVEEEKKDENTSENDETSEE